MTTDNSGSNISLHDYWNMLNRHDWYYQYSDDNRVYRAGSRAESDLRLIARQSQEHQALYDGFHRHKFTGPVLDGQDRAPKPPQPR
jgi:hypothetical protein